MTELLVFALAPDPMVRKAAEVAVAGEGHHLQTFGTSAELLAALGKNRTPHLILIEAEASGESFYNELLRYVPESKLCFMLKPGERRGGFDTRQFSRAR